MLIDEECFKIQKFLVLFFELDFIIKNSEGLNKCTDIGCFEQTGKKSF